MSAVAAIGEPDRVQGFALAGVTVLEAANAEQARAAWARLPADTAVAILTPAAHRALADALAAAPHVLPAVLP